MQRINIRNLLNLLNPVCTRALEGAAGMCVSRSHYEVTVEHLLARLLEEPLCDVEMIMNRFKVDQAAVRWSLEQSVEHLQTGNTGKPVFSPPVIQLCQDAWLVSSVELSQGHIRSGALLAALLARPLHLAQGDYIDLMGPIQRDDLLHRFWDIVQGSSEDSPEEKEPALEKAAPAAGSALGRFCTDFTARARNNEIDPVFGRDREIARMIEILARRRKNNPIVVGEAGVGKTAVVEGLALRIAEHDVPEFLAIRKVWWKTYHSEYKSVRASSVEMSTP